MKSLRIKEVLDTLFGENESGMVKVLPNSSVVNIFHSLETKFSCAAGYFFGCAHFWFYLRINWLKHCWLVLNSCDRLILDCFLSDSAIAMLLLFPAVTSLDKIAPFLIKNDGQNNENETQICNISLLQYVQLHKQHAYWHLYVLNVCLRLCECVPF